MEGSNNEEERKERKSGPERPGEIQEQQAYRQQDKHTDEFNALEIVHASIAGLPEIKWIRQRPVSNYKPHGQKQRRGL